MRLPPFGDGGEPARPRQEVAGRKKKDNGIEIKKKLKNRGKQKNEVAAFWGLRGAGSAAPGGCRPQQKKR